MTLEGRQGAAPANPDAAFGVLGLAPLAMILTQTCDLQNPNKIRAIPLINVAPVYNAYKYVDESQYYLLKRPRPFAYLVKLSPPGFAENKEGDMCWVADLRFDMPIDRAFLLRRDPIQGFATDDDYLEAGKAVALYRGRAAIDDRVLEHVLDPLGKMIKSDRELRKQILEVWIKCAPSSLQANRVRVQLLVEAGDRESVGDKVAEWYSANFMPEFVPKQLGITVLQPTVELLSEFGREKMRGALEVRDFGNLSAEDHR